MKQRKSNIETGSRVAGIVRSAETVSIELLQAVDATVSNLTAYKKVVDGLAEMFRASIDDVDCLGVTEGEYIDPDDVAIDGMMRASDHFKDRLAKMVLARAAVDRDNRLRGHHCEALHDAYEVTTTSLAEIIEVISLARSAIIQHDLAAEPRGGSFSSVEELIASLQK